MDLPIVASSWGAPMGRASDDLSGCKPKSLRLAIVPLNVHGYDAGGAYWGISDRALYRAYDDEGRNAFTRAGTRAEAAYNLGIKVGQLLYETPREIIIPKGSIYHIVGPEGVIIGFAQSRKAAIQNLEVFMRNYKHKEKAEIS